MQYHPGVSHLRTLLVLACAPLFAQPYTISTIAGKTIAGKTIAGKSVAGVVLTYPTSVAVDPADDVYVADWSGLIRKVWMKNGGTTTVAGNGTLGYSGDGGQAINAMIGKAVSIALDAAGNLYFADGDNNRIRRVDMLTGIITTAAGTGAALDSGDRGPAIHAGVSRPTGIAIDAAGDLYFSSSWSRIRKLTLKTGIIETIAGQPINGFSGDNGPAAAALFWDPIPSAIGPAGDIYIADYENSRVRIVTSKTGIVNTFAGSGACPVGGSPSGITVCQGGFAGDGGPARNATLNYPASVALDAAGNVYIADTINHRIRLVDASTGLIRTIAGNVVNGFSGDGGPALAAGISFPTGIAVDPSGRVYFADENNHCIRMLTPAASPHDRFRLSPRRP
jgi:trimeric autotransporter adhesin